MKLILKEITNNDFKIYDDFIDQSKYGTIFHKSWWLNNFDNYNIKFYLVYKDDILISVFPIPIKKLFIFKTIKQPPQTPYLGPIFSDYILNSNKKYTFIKNIYEILLNLINKKIVLNYNFNFNHKYMLPFIWKNYDVNLKFTYCIDLSKNIKEIYSSFDKTIKYEINKTKKMNGFIKEDNINDFLKLNNSLFKRKKLNNVNNIWYNIFLKCKKENCYKILTYYLNKKPIASILVVWDDYQMFYIGSGRSLNSKNTLSYLLYNAIIYAKNKKLYLFNFEGSSIKSIEKYFRKFGGEIYPIYSISKKNIFIKLLSRLKRLL